jgi:hypothetical protein
MWCQNGVKRAGFHVHPHVASLVCFLKLSRAFGPLIDNFCPGFVLQLFPLLAFVFGSQATHAKPGFAIEFADIDTGRLHSHYKSIARTLYFNPANLARCMPMHLKHNLDGDNRRAPCCA